MRCAAGMIRSKLCPTASRATWPNVASAPAFQVANRAGDVRHDDRIRGAIDNLAIGLTFHPRPLLTCRSPRTTIALSVHRARRAIIAVEDGSAIELYGARHDLP